MVNTFVVAIDFECRVRNADGTEVVMHPQDPLVCKEQEQIERTKKSMLQQSGTAVTIQTMSKQPLTGIFFDRESDILLIVGPGFGKPIETLRLYARVFYNYDVLIYDYRWVHDIKSLVFNRNIFKSPTTTLFEWSQEDVQNVVQFGRSYKKYNKVIGLGICFSCYQFLAAQAEYTKRSTPLFDALILDSCILSTEDIQKQILHNISLLYNPLQDDEPGWLQKIWEITGIPDLVTWLLSKISYHSTLPLLSQIGDLPILCIHGRADRLVPLESFERIWDCVQYPHKEALITPSSHVLNICNKAVYKIVCDHFIETL
jgi:hypothetical protein